MFVVPLWIINPILLVTCWLSVYQLSQLRRANPVPTLQFFMVIFSLGLLIAITFHRHPISWITLAVFLIAVVDLAIMVRQHRMLPPRKPLE